MMQIIEQLFDGKLSQVESQALITVIALIASTLASTLIGRYVKTPGRPENDPYADAEFEENGVLKKKPEASEQ